MIALVGFGIVTGGRRKRLSSMGSSSSMVMRGVGVDGRFDFFFPLSLGMVGVCSSSSSSMIITSLFAVWVPGTRVEVIDCCD